MIFKNILCRFVYSQVVYSYITVDFDLSAFDVVFYDCHFVITLTSFIPIAAQTTNDNSHMFLMFQNSIALRLATLKVSGFPCTQPFSTAERSNESANIVCNYK